MLRHGDLRDRSGGGDGRHGCLYGDAVRDKPTGKFGERVPDAVDFDKLRTGAQAGAGGAGLPVAVRADADVGAVIVIADMVQPPGGRRPRPRGRLAWPTRTSTTRWARATRPSGNIGCVLDRRRVGRSRCSTLSSCGGCIWPTERSVRGSLSGPGRCCVRLVPLVKAVSWCSTLCPAIRPISMLPSCPSSRASWTPCRASTPRSCWRPRAGRLAGSGAASCRLRTGARPWSAVPAVLALLRLVRDNLDWPDVVAYVDSLPDRLRRHPLVMEQRLLALAKQKEGDPAGAAGALKQLIRDVGPTSSAGTPGAAVQATAEGGHHRGRAGRLS